MTTQHELIASDLLTQKIPILRETATLIADPQVRYVGTLGGNVANGDPGNDMPAVMMCLERDLSRGRQIRRAPHCSARILPRRLFHSAGARRNRNRHPHSDAGGRARLRLREAQTQGRRLCHRSGCGCAVTASGGKVASCSIGLTNVAETPLWAEEAGKILTGSALDAATVKRAVAAAEAITSPASDASRTRRTTAPRWLA